MEKACESTLFLRHSASTMILYLDSSSSNAEELADLLNNLSQYFKDEIKYALPFSHNSKLKNKFYAAFKIINLRKVEEYVKAIQSNASDEYLANLSYFDKCSLSTHLLLLGEELSTIGIQSEKEKEQCFDILRNSIDKDFEKEAQKYGLTSDECKKYLSSHKRIIIPSSLSEENNQLSEKPVEKVKK